MVMDGFDLVMDDPDTNVEAENVYENVLSEIGLEYIEGQPAVPSKDLKPIKDVKVVDQTDELEARLAALKMPC